MIRASLQKCARPRRATHPGLFTLLCVIAEREREKKSLSTRYHFYTNLTNVSNDDDDEEDGEEGDDDEDALSSLI